ncbi:hypothetical protein [Clostridiisalibacter paucivorans]|uniref:hypothetical protein n=1 Tax=Clostridiisalibacter paucivorans TaxID=408753 RepID=UPI00047E8EE2|nr:hypothetical protein [Clostridiisalibacter paucivorans]
MSLVLVLSSITALANSTKYTSTLSLSMQSSATGQTRDYFEPYHKMSMHIDSRGYDNGDDDKNYVDVTLEKKKTFSYEDCKTIRKNCKNVDSTYYFSYGKQGKGKFRYYFDNYYNYKETLNGYKSDTFTSKNVTMTSYD